MSPTDLLRDVLHGLGIAAAVALALAVALRLLPALRVALREEGARKRVYDAVAAGARRPAELVLPACWECGDPVRSWDLPLCDEHRAALLRELEAAVERLPEGATVEPPAVCDAPVRAFGRK